MADIQKVYCVECGAETETDCICDDLNYADGERVVINGEVYARERE
jgi:hypothetical protein